MNCATCPDHEELRAFTLGKLPDEAVEQIAAHLDDCPSCHATVEGLSSAGDTVAESLRQTVLDNPFAEEPEWRNALAFIEEIGRTGAPAGVMNRRPLGTVRDYRLLEEIGHGGMGAVYKAEHVRLKRIVALKLLPDSRLKDVRAVARFAREMEAIGRFEHPNIVRAMDAGEHEGLHYLVMEFVPGMDLSRLTQRLGGLSLADACEVIRQAAIGLQHVHEQGLIHRDLKPSNLMLTPEGEVKILDLGLALFNESSTAAPSTELTTAGQFMGTIDYMAPEQMDDSHVVDIRADIYSLGATLYKLLCGAAPFESKRFSSPAKRIAASMALDPPPITDRREDVPAELAAIVHRMLARDPNQRYAAPAEVAAALGPWTGGADLAGLIARTSSGAAPGAADAAGSTAELWQSRLEDTQTPETPIETPATVVFRPEAKAAEGAKPASRSSSSRPRRSPWISIAAGLAVVGLLAAGVFLVRIATDQGELVIESAEPGVEVTIRRNGEKVRDLELKQGRNETTIRSGEYEIVLTGANTDGMRVENERFLLTRGGEEIVRIGRGPPTASTVASPAASSVVHPIEQQPAAVPEPPPEHPVDEEFVQAVARMPSEEQVAAVAEKLQQLNPGFDGKVESTVREGVVVGLRFNAEQVTDLSPVQALAGLQSLDCYTNSGIRGKLADLSPLQGLELHYFSCNRSNVSDLGPLRGMPLKDLHISYTDVSDLSPLQGLPLEILHCDSTAIKDLAPLRETKTLKVLYCQATGIHDLGPLQGLPLEYLEAASTAVADLLPVKDAPLKFLRIQSTKVTDLSPLRGLPLEELNCMTTDVYDLSPLKGMRLRVLRIQSTPIVDLAPLAEMPLQHLVCDVRPYDTRWSQMLRSLPLDAINYHPPAEYWKAVEDRLQQDVDFNRRIAALPLANQAYAVAVQLSQFNPAFDRTIARWYKDDAIAKISLDGDRVQNLAPLRALPKLTTLVCAGSPEAGYGPTTLYDLSPLAGLPLESLDCSHTKVWDLSPLQESPLTSLNIAGTRVADLAPLTKLPLESLDCDAELLQSHAPVLREIKTLKTINGRPAEEALAQPATP